MNFNKVIVNISLVIFLFAVKSFPQQNAKYFDAPFGGGGGYAPGWFMPDLNPVNKELKGFGMPGLSTGGFYTSGGAGFIYIGFVPGLRIGGMGFGGSSSESSKENGLNKESIYTLGGGGLTVEYSVPFIRNVGVSVGATIGRGSLQIELYQNKDSYNWNDISSVSGGIMSNDLSSTINNSFWIFSPTLNIDIPFYRFVVFRIGAGYQLSLGESWTLENDRELKDVPSEINGKSFFIQSGIFIGFFSF